MKKLIIADISGFSYRGMPSAHYWKVARDYYFLLKNDFITSIAGPKIYGKLLNDYPLKTLRYKIQGLKSYNVFENIKKIFYEICNFKQVLAHNPDIIIFQSCGFLSLIIGLIIFKPKKRIYIMQYTNRLDSGIYRKLYNYAKQRIEGTITGLYEVGQMYSDRVIVMPDYIYIEDTFQKNQSRIKYDFLVCGIMFPEKDIEQVVEVFSKMKFKVKISGYFHSKERFNLLKSIASDNIEIDDRYLSNKEYNLLIKQSKFVILPYKEHYNDATSGVVYDAIFRRKPIITKALNGMEFVRESNIGFLYKKNIKEFFDTDYDYNELIKNIDIFLKQNQDYKMKIVNFIKGDH